MQHRMNNACASQHTQLQQQRRNKRDLALPPGGVRFQLRVPYAVIRIRAQLALELERARAQKQRSKGARRAAMTSDSAEGKMIYGRLGKTGLKVVIHSPGMPPADKGSGERCCAGFWDSDCRGAIANAL